MGVKKQSYEQAIQELEALVEKLEAGNLPLEESLALYEKASRLALQCNTQLEKAQLKIEELRVLEASDE